MTDIHVFIYGDKYIILDINTSRCIELDRESYEALTGSENMNSSGNDVLKEYTLLKKVGFFTSAGVENSDYTIHEIHLGAFTKCNLSCRYCFRHDNIQDENQMDISKALKVVDRIIERLVVAKKTTWFFFNIGLTGETLVDINFSKKIQNHISMYAQRENMKLNCVFSNTNAVLLNSKNVNELWAASHMTPISISIDGPKHIHDDARCFPNGEGSYDIIESNVIECNKRVSSVGEATLTGKMPYVTEVFTHLCSLGFSSISIKPVRVKADSEYAINADNIENVKKGYSDFVKFLISQDDSKLLDYLSRISDRDYFGRFFLRIFLGEKTTCRCNASISLIAVDYNGDIFPCASLMGIDYFKIGNIFDDESVWENKRLELLNKMHLCKKQECLECWARNLCGGGCASGSFLSGGNIDSPDPCECELIKHVIEQAMTLLSEISERQDVLHALDSRYRYRAPHAVVPVTECSFTEISPIGNFSAWNGAQSIELGKKEQLRGFKIWDDSKCFKAVAMTLWDERNFYLKVDVKEEEFGADTFSNESIVRFSITDKLSVLPCEYSIGVKSGKPILIKHRLEDRPKNYLGEIDDAEIIITRNEGITTYVLSVPWYQLKLFPSENTICKFNIAVYSREIPYVPKAWLEWSPGIVVENHPALFGSLKFIHTV